MGTSDSDDIRIHSEAPAEGDDSRDFPEIRSHSQDPAEGSDSAEHHVPEEHGEG
jgi:hypothetical protein